MSLPSWLPPIIELSSCSGDWSKYESTLYKIFERDFIKSKPILFGKPVFCTKDPTYKGKFFTFYHITTCGGPREEDRTTDLRRCERIEWLKKILENTNDPSVKVWEDKRSNRKRRNKKRTNVLFDESGETLHLVLSKNVNSYHLVTVYYVEKDYKKQELNRQYLRLKTP